MPENGPGEASTGTLANPGQTPRRTGTNYLLCLVVREDMVFITRVPGPAGEREGEMIQVVFEVHAGAARFRVSARARSIRRAMSIAGARYPSAEVKLALPVEPETFFVEAAPDRAEPAGLRVPEPVVV